MIDVDVSASTGRTTSAEPVRRPLRAAARHGDPLVTLADTLRRLVKELGPNPKPRAVHQLRTTIRRFETLLAGADAASRAERKTTKQLDRLRKRAGKVRDADVQLQALATLARGSARDAYDRVREALTKERERRQKRLARAMTAERERGLLKHLRQVVRHAPVHPAAGVAEGERILAEVRERFAAALQAATPLGAGNLHAFRIEAKRLRYRAEIAGASAATTVAQLKRVQDAAGAWHDWVTLGERAEQVLGDGPTPILAAMRARAASKLENAVTVVARVGRRLERLRGPSPRKGVRPVTGERSPAALRSAGASA